VPRDHVLDRQNHDLCPAMADPLSIVGSVVGIISLGITEYSSSSASPADSFHVYLHTLATILAGTSG
jgi:hypothetical protein